MWYNENMRTVSVDLVTRLEVEVPDAASNEDISRFVKALMVFQPDPSIVEAIGGDASDFEDMDVVGAWAVDVDFASAVAD